jgi:cytochrome oxidase assembly protein ShyY1
MERGLRVHPARRKRTPGGPPHLCVDVHLIPLVERAARTRSERDAEDRAGEPGYVQVVDCVTSAEGPGMSVELGWSKNPNAKVDWHGGPVSGIIAPDSRTRMRLVAATAPPGLETSAPPSLNSIPNNHRSYALQWFSFAIIALIIYGLAVRKRLKEEQPRP